MAPVSLVFTFLTAYICFANGPCSLPYWLVNDISTRYPEGYRFSVYDDTSYSRKGAESGFIHFSGDDLLARNMKLGDLQQSSCLSSADGGATTCKSLFDCPPLLAIVTKKDKTQQDLDLLKKSQCGFEGTAPKVCCPSSCFTPDGQQGNCVSIYSCSHLANLLKPPVSKENMQFVQNSKCTGSHQYSVCCGPPKDGNRVMPGNCAAKVSAFPPDPRSECCGVDSSVGNKIVGGTATTVDQYPWLVIIEYIQQSKIRLLCGGALISGKYVLSAAHCVTGDVLQYGTPKNVRLGEYDTKNDGPDCALVEAGGEDCTEGTVTLPIEKLIPHPDYSTTRKHSPHDIALIRLAQMAPFTEFIRPICLPSVDLTLSPPHNFTLFAAGWGAVSVTQAASNLKIHVDLPYVGRQFCEPAYKTGGRNLKLTSGQICAGGVTGKDSCKGDSGGPLMYENGRTFEIIGIVSFGPTPCGLPNVPGVYTKVYEYNTWIRNNIVA